MSLLLVSVREQTLFLYQGRSLLASYPVSTADRGMGEASGSFKTPRGWHVIRAKIGCDQPVDAVFKARRPVHNLGSMPHQASSSSPSDEDLIVGRILWLSGLEPGFNRLRNQGVLVDSMQRFIYIHGTAAPVDGVPRSIGCIRMRPEDVVALADRVVVGDRIYIQSDLPEQAASSAPLLGVLAGQNADHKQTGGVYE